MAKYIYQYHDERGEFNAYVSDETGKTIWEVHYPDYYEDDETGELIEGSTIFDDGFMKNADDTNGLKKYLTDMGFLSEDDELVMEEYKLGGTLGKIANKQLSGSFALPIEMAILVPSTRNVSEIINKTDFQKRVEEVQVYLSTLFGGYSAAPVDGSYVSSDKGLVKEDVERVVAFATEDAFKDKLHTLISKIKVWCENWGQEAIGYELEGDLYYVSGYTADAKNIAAPEANSEEERNKIWDGLTKEQKSKYIEDAKRFFETEKMKEGGEITEDDAQNLDRISASTGIPVDVLVEYAEYQGIEISDLTDDINFYGKYDSKADFAERLVDDGVISNLEPYLEMYPTDMRIIAQEEADSRVDNMDDDDLLKEAGSYDDIERASEIKDEIDEKEEGIDNLKEEIKELYELEDNENSTEQDREELEKKAADIKSKISDIQSEISVLVDEYLLLDYKDRDRAIEDAKDELRDSIYEEVYGDLQNDAVGYFVNNFGYDVKDLVNNSSFHIDYDRLADDLESDHIFIMNDDGDLYVFGNYANGGVLFADGGTTKFVEHTSNGLSIIEKNGFYGLITEDGEVVAPAIYTYIDTQVSPNGYVRVQKKDGSYGLIEAFYEEEDFEEGGSNKKSKKYWIQDAIKHEGALRETAKRKGLIKGEEKLSMSDLKKLEKAGPKTARRARLAETLRKFKKGGEVKSVRKLVDEVNRLIGLAKYEDGEPIPVYDTSSTWQSPMVFNPFVYSRGTLYYSYLDFAFGFGSEPKLKKEVVRKVNMDFDGVPVLRWVAKMYRKALKQEGISYADGGFMAYGGESRKYEIYHDTLSSALEEIEKWAEKNGYEFTGEGYFPDVTVGGISYGETKRFSRPIKKNGFKKEGKIMVQIYRMDSGKYELNLYPTYEDGGFMADSGELTSDELFLLEKDGNVVKLNDGINYKIKASTSVAIYPYKRTIANILFIPISKSSQKYKEIKEKLGDDWLTDWKSLSIENRVSVLNQLGKEIAAKGIDLGSSFEKMKRQIFSVEIPGDKKFKYGITYATVTPESAEIGDYEDTGWEIEKEEEELSEILKIANSYAIYEPSGSPIHGGEWWSSVDPSQDRAYFEKGEATYYSLHIAHLDGTDLNKEETEFVTEKLKSGRKLDWDEIDKEWCADGGETKTDTITVNVPLFIRLQEYAREDAKSDVDLHKVAQRAVELGKNEHTLTMEDYQNIVREMADGGSIPAGYHMMPDGTIMPDSAHMDDGGVIASSSTKEGIKKLISEYYYSKNISLDPVGDEYEIKNAKGKIKGVKVIIKKGRYLFVHDKKMADGGVVLGDKIKFTEGFGYWDLSKYKYGNDFKRFKGGEGGQFIKGTRKLGNEIRVKLDDGREIITQIQAIDLPTYEEKQNVYEKNKHLFSFGYEDGGETEGKYDILSYNVKTNREGEPYIVQEKRIQIIGTYEKAIEAAKSELQNIKYGEKAYANVLGRKRAKVKRDGVVESFEQGGDLDEQNRRMVESRAIGIQHHVTELKNQLRKNPMVDAWVVAKAETAYSDLEAITHYLEAKNEMMEDEEPENKEMADGGEIEQKGNEYAEKIKAILSKELPGFYTDAKYKKGSFGNPYVAIYMATSDHEINRVSMQYTDFVSLILDLKDMELRPQVFGGNGGQRIYVRPDRDNPKEKYLAMAGIKVPFRKPKTDEKSILEAVKKFAQRYKELLIEYRERLLYGNVVDYDKLLK